MKKVIKIILGIIISMFICTNVYAKSASISVSTSSSQIIVGNTVKVTVTVSSTESLGAWEYTLNYDKSIFSLVSSNVDLHYAAAANNNSTKTVSYLYTFKANKSGKGSFYIDSSSVLNMDEEYLDVSNGSRAVSAITYTEYQASLSNNNNLRSLSVDGYEISPEFNKDTLEYTVKVNEDEKTVKINASAEDKAARVNGTGEVEVVNGTNSFNIVVVAENGSEKTYKLIVDVVDKNPIDVKVDGKDYTVVKIVGQLSKPESFTETKVTIDENEIPAFYNEVIDYTLVGLKDETGKVNLYKYDDGKYELYKELKIGQLTLSPMDMDEEIKGYNKSSIKIGDYKVECLELSNSNRYKIIKALNVETNEEGLYLYDKKDNSAIKYDDSYIKTLTEKNKMLVSSTIAFIVTTILSMIAFIVVSSKKGKKIVKQTEKNYEEIDNKIREIKEKINEEDTMFNIMDDKPKKKNKKSKK